MLAVSNSVTLCVQSTLMVRVWKVTNWTEVHDRMKEGERIYSDKFPIANVTGTWQVYCTYMYSMLDRLAHNVLHLGCNVLWIVLHATKSQTVYSAVGVAASTCSLHMILRQTCLLYC